MLGKHSATKARCIPAPNIKIYIALILPVRTRLLLKFPINDPCPPVTMLLFFNFIHLGVLTVCVSVSLVCAMLADTKAPETRVPGGCEQNEIPII